MEKRKSKAKLILRSFRNRGIWLTLKLNFYEYFFDFKYNVETRVSNSLIGENLNSLVNKDITSYQACNFLRLNTIFSDLLIDLENIILLDIGCGKGRVCLYASLCGVSRIYGVDFSENLIEKAKQNLKNIRIKDKLDIEFFCADILQFTIPSDVNTLFLFNPFGNKTMASLYDTKIKDNKKISKIILCNPICLDLFEGQFYQIFNNSEICILSRV